MMDTYALQPTEFYQKHVAGPRVVLEQRLTAEQLGDLQKPPLELRVAQNGNASPQTTSIDNSKYTTVEEVLAETPFRKIRLEDLEKEISKGVSVLFFYDRTTSSFNSAIMWRRVFSELPDTSGINFINLEYGGPANHDIYVKFGLLRKPAYAYYKDGKRLYLHFGGPANTEDLETDVGISKRNLVRLRNLNK